MTSTEQIKKILDELEECGFDGYSMMWFHQELEKLVCITKEEATK